VDFLHQFLAIACTEKGQGAARGDSCAQDWQEGPVSAAPKTTWTGPASRKNALDLIRRAYSLGQ
jgi:hypothetical protein